MVKQKVTREAAIAESTAYFKGNTLAAAVVVDKYFLKDTEGNIYEKSPSDTHARYASEFARIENKYFNPLSEQEIYDLFDGYLYTVLGGGGMAGVGNNFQVTSLSNCFVTGNKNDSYGGIYRTEEQQTQLMKRRGGVGHDISHLRPKGFPVKNSALFSTGVVPYMERFSNATKEVAQDGRR